MIIGAIFFAFVAACAVVMFAAIVKSAVDDTRAANATPPTPSGHIVLPGDRDGRFAREPARTGRFDRDRRVADRRAEPVDR